LRDTISGIRQNNELLPSRPATTRSNRSRY
jgi:hypothetical protein